MARNQRGSKSRGQKGRRSSQHGKQTKRGRSSSQESMQARSRRQQSGGEKPMGMDEELNLGS